MLGQYHGQIDGVNCGVDSRNEQGCLSGKILTLCEINVVIYGSFQGFYQPASRTKGSGPIEEALGQREYSNITALLNGGGGSQGAAFSCPPGFWCPEGFVCLIPCLPGGHCVPYEPKYNRPSNRSACAHLHMPPAKPSLIYQHSTTCLSASAVNPFSKICPGMSK